MGQPEIPLPTQARPERSSRVKPLLILMGVLLAIVQFYPQLDSLSRYVASSPSCGRKEISQREYTDHWIKANARCPAQPKALHPKSVWNMTEEERVASLKKLSAAVQIRTESFDDNGEVDEDPRWKPFFDFQSWLKETFPLAHEKANVEYINTLGILATFQGSDQSLKPLLLMSHYDVVPAPDSTLDRWTYPPFSGHVDGEHIWGRGAADDKTLLVAQWEAMTHLLENGFEPRRTVILSHGFDEEEVFARRGQGRIAPFLEERYGHDGLLMVIDEGSGWTDDFYGAAFALPGMGEKGYLDIKITVATAGGHSSVPPENTGIGIASQAVAALEANPFPVKLTPASPILTSLYCASEHAKLPKQWKSLLKKEGPHSYPKLAKHFADESVLNRAEVGTTIAVDVINGGVKVNALPEVVTVLINHRIDFDESIASTQAHVSKLLARVAKHHDMAFASFSHDNATRLGGRYIKVETLGQGLEPAPRTPSSGGVWDLFAGTVRSTFPAPGGGERIVSPSASTGNTDCKMYYNLSKHIYRFMGGRTSASYAHTVDERATVKAHFDIIAWIHAIVQNADAYDGEQ